MTSSKPTPEKPAMTDFTMHYDHDAFYERFSQPQFRKLKRKLSVHDVRQLLECVLNTPHGGNAESLTPRQLWELLDSTLQTNKVLAKRLKEIEAQRDELRERLSSAAALLDHFGWSPPTRPPEYEEVCANEEAEKARETIAKCGGV